ncbi:MAG TPA: ABC transporter ATP-binding protein [Treponema sp.]|nr:ABC transporter ATP-binding protein [Treponema sp.]
MSNDIAIRVENVSKYYRLGVINNGTLFRDIQSWIARKRGKEDPHAKIGSKYDPTLEGFWALKDLNFEIKKGDRVGIIGHNGAGKSTLLKILSGITTPTEGNIKINGRISSLLEVGTGFHPEMTGRENVYLNGAILGMKKSEINKKIDEIIEFSGIKEHIDTPVKRYSSGMYVRLAFAVAAHLDSDILIADEVLAVGDAAFQKKALGKMNELSSGEGRTVLFVSHNMAQVRQLCTKGILLNKGQILCQDKMSVVEDKYFERMNSSSYTDLSSYKPDYTDGSIVVNNFYSLNHSRDDPFIYDKRKKFKFGLEFSAKQTKKITFGISFCNSKGILFSPNMDSPVFIEKGKNYKLYIETDNYLMPGKYTVAFGFNENNQTSWWGTDIIAFEVSYAGREGYASIFDVDYRFDIKEI